MRAWTKTVVGVGLLVAAEAPSPASACAGSPCTPEQFVPASGSLPQNAAAIGVYLGSAWHGPERVRTGRDDLSLQCEDASGSSMTVPFELEPAPACSERPCSPRPALLVPRAELPLGGTCEITGIDCDLRTAAFGDILAGDDHLRSHAKFVVAAAAAVPTSLGTLELQGARHERIPLSAGGECSKDEDVCAVRAELALSAEAEPWRDALIYTTVVDGEPWSVSQSANLPDQYSGSYLGRGKDLFFYRLEDNGNEPLLERGMHRVTIEATLAGTDLVLATAEQTFELDCTDTEPSAEGDAGAVAARDGGTGRGDGTDTASGSGTVSARESDARDSQASDDSGCAVSSPGASGSPGFAALAALAAMIAWRTRRRRARIAGELLASAASLAVEFSVHPGTHTKVRARAARLRESSTPIAESP